MATADRVAAHPRAARVLRHLLRPAARHAPEIPLHGPLLPRAPPVCLFVLHQRDQPPQAAARHAPRLPRGEALPRNLPADRHAPVWGRGEGGGGGGAGGAPGAGHHSEGLPPPVPRVRHQRHDHGEVGAHLGLCGEKPNIIY
eukprot:5233685-Pyramimonas_sp.AAC.1